MKTPIKTIACLIIAFCCFTNIYSQGCSDAGVCSLGGLKADINNYHRSIITLNLQYGLGEQNVKIFTPQLEYLTRLSNKWSLQVKLPFVFASGNLGKVAAFGDITFGGIYQLYKKKNWQLSLNLGAKCPTSFANKKSKDDKSNPNTLSLPMPYQPGLGTYDALVGLDARYKENITMAVGFQMPVKQLNGNDFDTAKVPYYEKEKKQYFTSAQLFRRPDAIIRIDYRLKFTKNFSLYLGALPIYHLGHDRFTDTFGISHAIHGSKGLTLNIYSAIDIKILKNYSITLRYAAPAIVRKVRPDGLTRHYVIGLELKYYY